jgi:hypothetical protein
MLGHSAILPGAEEFRPGAEVLRGDSPGVAARYAEVFARLMAELADVTVAPPLPNPPWVRWDHTDPGGWPAVDCLDNRDQSVVPAYVVDAAGRARGRLLAAGLPCVLGHADFEAQNLRWHGREVWAVHDWDSLASRGRPACGWRRTTPGRRHCTATPRWAAMRSGHKPPNASAGPMPSTSMASSADARSLSEQMTVDVLGRLGPCCAPSGASPAYRSRRRR